MAAHYHGIEHLGIAVRNLDGAAATYRDLLGLAVGPVEEIPERGLAVRFVDTGGARLELLAPT
ncbi:MAG: VOC family protein, partial [Deltaproteobacteria bacterium]|nr:VOC family protein [Deltaproteobacteria bacterium]